MYYFVCSSKACGKQAKQAFRTSWEPLAMGSMSSTMMREELLHFASAVHTMHAFLHPCALTELSCIVVIALNLVLLAIFSTGEGWWIIFLVDTTYLG
jgi:hypothetical protein